MERKRYVLRASETTKTLRVSTDMYFALQIIARKMDCTIQEVSYRLLMRGLRWYQLRIAPQEGADKYQEWERKPGESASPDESDTRDYSTKRRPVPNNRRPSQPRYVIKRNPGTTPKEYPPLPEGYFPLDI